MKSFDTISFGVLEVTNDKNTISYNNFFETNILLGEQPNVTIDNLIDNFDIQNPPECASINGSTYKIAVQPLGDKYQIFFNEMTDQKEKTTVSLIFIDNYDEVLDSLEEFKHPLLAAIVDGRIKKMAKDFGGVIKRFEKDKHILILADDKLNELIETKFEILENIKEVDMGNTIPVTLSIGTGRNGSTLDENMEFARASIDLALSRGGDQVVIKDAENYHFFGGHSKGIERNSRVRARVKAYALTELIENASNVLIMGHKNVDLDCIGAGIGVYSIVSNLNKPCKIVLNNTTSSVNALYDRLIDDEKYKDVFVTSSQAIHMVNKKTLLIVVDVYKPSLCESPELIKCVNKIVVFDHHRRGAEYIDNAVLVYHEPYASSTCELVTEMLMYMEKPAYLRPIEADAILAGIIVDTKNFAFKTGAKTFEAAALLRKKGADTIRVKKLFKGSLESYTARSNTVRNMTIYREILAISVFDETSENPQLIIAQACDEILNIDNIQASFVLCCINDNVFISARSLEDINVQIIMEELGGGGHQSMAATQLKNTTITEAITTLKSIIDKHFEEEK